MKMFKAGLTLALLAVLFGCTIRPKHIPGPIPGPKPVTERGFGQSGPTGGGGGGTIADGSITNAKLADGAVTAQKVSSNGNYVVETLTAYDGVAAARLKASDGMQLQSAASRNIFAFTAHPSGTTQTWTTPERNGSAGALLTDSSGVGNLKWMPQVSQPLNDAASIVWNMSAGGNATVTLTTAIGGTRLLANPSNIVAGTSGILVITQDGDGAHALTFDTNWKFSGGVAPVLSTSASSVDVLSWFSPDGTILLANVNKDYK